MTQIGGTDKVKETASSEILAQLERTAERAEKAAATLAERTSSVTRQPEPSGKPDSNPIPEYPSLFSRINELIESINNSLDRIEDNMRRIEL